MMIIQGFNFQGNEYTDGIKQISRMRAPLKVYIEEDRAEPISSKEKTKLGISDHGEYRSYLTLELRSMSHVAYKIHQRPLSHLVCKKNGISIKERGEKSYYVS